MAKKNFVSDHQKQPVTSMSHVQPRAVDVAENTNPSFSQEDDEDDDICPVCESECTCRNRATTTTLPTPSTSSITTPSIAAQNAGPLKIKLTLPPHLKARRLQPSPQPSSESTAGVTQAPSGALPRRRGRPSKAAVAAREVASRSQPVGSTNVQPLPTTYRTKGKATQVAKPKKPKLAGTFVSNRASSSRAIVPPTPAQDSDFDGVRSDAFPTFVSASALSHSSSSESDESITSLSSDEQNIDSEIEDGHIFPHPSRHKSKNRKELFGDEASRRRPVHSNNWEIKSRSRSEGPEDAFMDTDSDAHSSSDEGADDEDEDGDEQEDDDDAEADVENEGLAEPDDEDEPPIDGKLGVSFGGVATGWSEDEESSFDAELFFANLEDSSDSDAGPKSLHDPASPSDVESDTGFSHPMSNSEHDTLMFMDVDSSRGFRGSNDLEFGVSFSFGWDGQFILPRQNDSALLDIDLGLTTETDIDMTAGSEGETTADDATQILQDGSIVLEETDGETTEDELVDANGLPNSRAMMLFRWPTTVSAINPLSTVSNPSTSTANNLALPPNASPSVRIALASFPAQLDSPAPTPADILAGKVRNGDLDELEIKQGGGLDMARRRGAFMGSFAMTNGLPGAFAVVDGSGQETPTPFPRRRVIRKPEVHHATGACNDLHIESANTGRLNDDPLPSDSIPPSSSDEVAPQSQTQESDDSADTFDLGDVLEPSFLDLEPMASNLNGTDSLWSSSGFQSDGTHINSLSRWDRIPVATFRRTRETATLDYAGSDTSVGVAGTPLTQSPLKSREKLPKPVQEKRKGKRAQKLIISPVILPLRDGDGVLSAPDAQFGSKGHQYKNRKEGRDGAKKKALSKYASRQFQKHQQHHSHHHHYPNMKSRASSSMQRSNFFASSSSSVPHLSL